MMPSMPLLASLFLLVQTNWLVEIVAITDATPSAARRQSQNPLQIENQANNQRRAFEPEDLPTQAESQQSQQIHRRQQTADTPVEILCQHEITTPPVADPSSIISAYGILFTVSSPHSSQNSNKEMVISTLGFYVDTDKLNSIEGDVHYEVYTLPGHYADPDRTNEGNGGLPLNPSWDYRGDNTYWEKIAEGAIGMDDLQVSPPDANNDVSNIMTEANYFQIPFGEFQPTPIPSTTASLASGDAEEVQSFYITLRELGALMYAPLEGWEDLHDEQSVMYCAATRTVLASDGTTSLASGGILANCVDGDIANEKPILHIGEGVVSYPFPIVPYFYQPRKFMGSIYYLNDCPTASPSTMPSDTSIPSSTLVPSYEPTVVGTMEPSYSLVPTSPPSRSPPPTPYSYIYAGQYGCHSSISTDRLYDTFKSETSSSYGIVFPIQSNENDIDGVWITSLGFHVDFSKVSPMLDDDKDNTTTTLNYEVYALAEEGLYADPNRTSTGGSAPQTFDYRGDFTLWNKISTGTLSEDELVDGDYFRIPWAQFEPTFVSQLGGIRSFYLTMSDSGALVYMDLARKGHLGSIQRDDFYNNNRDKTQEPPTLLYGEGVIGYPFHSSLFLYSPKHFIGKVFYEQECPSQAPSLSPSLHPSESPSVQPSHSPSYQPSFEPSQSPSVSPSWFPSKMPSFGPSETPSLMPSISPTVSISPTHVNFPSVPPTATTSPTNTPSMHPTSSQGPSTSWKPSSLPSPQSSPKPILPQLSSATLMTSSLEITLVVALSLAFLLCQ